MWLTKKIARYAHPAAPALSWSHTCSRLLCSRVVFLAFLAGSFVSIVGRLQAQAEEILSSMSVASLWERRLAYILTLGVVPLYRRNGLGALRHLRHSKHSIIQPKHPLFGCGLHSVHDCVCHWTAIGRQLLDKLQEYLKEHDKLCQALYLHCLSTNRPALRFYEVQCTFKPCGSYSAHIYASSPILCVRFHEFFRLQDAGFEQLGLKNGFYFFHEAKHDAMLLARYFNGGRRPWKMADFQQMLWVPVNFIIGIARGGARLVHGTVLPTTGTEIGDEEATADPQPPHSSLSQQQHQHCHQAQEGQPGDQLAVKAAITIPIEVEEGVRERRGEEGNGAHLLSAGRGSVEGCHQA